MTQRWGESGNVFFTLFGAVALVGVVGAATSTLMRGPVGTVVSLNQRAKADSQMQIAMKLAMLEAQQRTIPSSPDCDADTLIEPVAPGAALPGLTGGGQLPSVGSTTNDPWGVPYGYCAWDHAMVGGATMGSNCAGAGLLDGEEGASGLVIAIISAGPDRTFGITCNAQPAADYLTRGANGADDIVVDMTYAEANEASGGLWHIKSGNPDQITTGKELDVQQGAQFSSGNVDFTGSTITGSSAYDSGASLDLSAGGLFMLPDQTVLPDTDCDDPGDIPANSGLLRRYTGGAGEVLQICDGIADPMSPAWTDIGGSGGAVAAAGNNTEVQFNAGGVLSASPNFVWTGTMLDITGAGDFSTDLNVGDELVVGGVADLNGALDVAGNTNLGGTLDVSGVTDINNQLNVTGAADFGDTFNADGAATFGNTLAVTGNASFTAQVLGSAGSAAQPSYAFSGSSSTGIYYTSSGMGFSIGGTNEMTLSSAGLEVNNLTVVNNISADRFLSDMSTTSAALPGFQTEPGTGIFSPVDNSLSLVTGGSTRLIIDGTGDVGIGVAVPEATLDVGGEIKVGTSAVPCAVSIHGAIRYVSGDLLQVCSSMTNNWEDIGTSGGGGGGAASYWTRISVADPRLYYTDDFVGVGTNDPLATFHVNGDFLNTGSYTGTASVPVSGAGTRMFFDAETGAFRAGTVGGAYWDNANIGNYSVAMGENAQASGAASLALGSNVTATQAGAIALGTTTRAAGANSMALGLGSVVGGIAPAVTGANSYGIFMGPQPNMDIQAANTMALIGGRMLIDQSPSITTPSVSGTLSLDVEGGVGAVQYCDEDGTNCFTAASVATGGVGAPGLNREVIFNSGGVLGTDTNFVFTSSGRMGIGTNNPLSPLDVRGSGILTANTTGRSLVFATGTGDGSNFSGLLAGDQATGRTWGFVHSQALANHLSIGYENGLGGYLPSIIASPTGRVLFGSSGTIHGGLQVDVDGPVGATQYCDNFGLNCFTPDDIVNAELAYGTDGTIQFASGGALWGSPNYMWNEGTSTLAVTGNTTISGTLDLTGNGAMVMPRGATADRPAGVDGMIRYNSQTGHFEGYQGGQWQDILTGSALAANPDRGIQFNSGGTFAADANLVYSSQGALMVSGTHTGAGAPPATGAGTRMFFDPTKSAFRAGAVNAGQWDNADIGEYSAAFGLNTRATNSYSAAFGLAATASGITSFATGFGAQASGDASFAMGNLSQAAGTQSFAAGLWAYAGGDTSMAMGNYARATGIGGISLGRHVTVGNDVLASGFGDGSMAIGLIDDAVTITTASQVRGIQSMGIFMGDQDGLVMTADNTMGLFGGNMVIDPRVPASQLAARSVLDLGAATDSIVMPSGTTAQRPGAPVEGMIRYNAERSRFEGYQAGEWQDILTGSALAAAPERGIQFNSGGNFAADANFAYLSTGSLIVGAPQIDDTGNVAYDRRMVFDKATGAFRAGVAYGDEWDIGNLAEGSVAFGTGNRASGFASSVFGRYSEATASYGFAAGYNMGANADTAIALGSNADVTGTRSFAFGLGASAINMPVVSGTESLGIFMGNQNAVDITSTHTMALLGGSMVIDPRSIATNLAADTAFEVEGTMKMAYGGEACDAAREGAIHYNSSDNNFYVCKSAGLWDVLATGTPAAAAPDRGIQFNSGGSFTADAGFVYTSSGSVGIGTASPIALLEANRDQNAYTVLGVTNYTDGAGAAAVLGAISATSEIGLVAHPDNYWATHLADRASLFAPSASSLTGRVTSGLDLIAEDAAADMRFYTGGFATTNERMRISSVGDVTLNGTGAIKLHSGTTAQRPGTAIDGMIRYNSESGKFEGYQAGAWQDILTSAVAGGAAAPDRGIQFNSGGSFAAVANLTYTSTGALEVGDSSSENALRISGGAGAPTLTAAGTGTNVGLNFSAKGNGTFNFSTAGYITSNFSGTAEGWVQSTAPGGGRSGYIISGNAGISSWIMTGQTANTFTLQAGNNVNSSPVVMRIDSSGNSTFAGDMTFNGTGATLLNRGATAQRPGTAIDGMIRYNSETGKFEGYQAGAWQDILTSAVAGGAAAPVDAVQFNSGGNFAGSAQFVYNETDGLRVGWGADPSYYDATVTLFENASGASLRWGPTHVDSSTIAGYLGYDGGAEQVLFTANNASAIFGRYGSTDLVVNKDTGFVGLGGLLAPDATLDVNGIAKIAYNGELCDAAREGAIHYNSSDNNFYVCKTSGAWDVLATGTPNAAAPDRGIQFNSGGSFTANAGLTFSALGDIDFSSGNMNLTGGYLNFTGDSVGLPQIRTSGPTSLYMGANNNGSQLVLSYDGNVGIGTAPTKNLTILDGTETTFRLNSGNVSIWDYTTDFSAAGDEASDLVIKRTGAAGDIVFESNFRFGIATYAPQASVDIATTDGIILPRGDTAQRPAAPVNGMIRYNSESGKFEGYQAGSWQDIVTGAVGAAAPDRGIQFNSGGNFAADANFTYTSTERLGVGTSQPQGVVHAHSATNDGTIAISSSNLSTVSSVDLYTNRAVAGADFGNGSNKGWSVEAVGDSGFFGGYANYLFIRSQLHANPAARNVIAAFDGVNYRMALGSLGGGATPLATLHVFGTDSIILPSGTTAQRSSAPVNGMIRYNSENGKFEGYQAGSWQDIVTGAATSTFLSLTDTPATYAGSTGYFVKVNPTDDGLIFSSSLVNIVGGIPAPTGLMLDDIDDVVAPTPSTGNALVWNGTAWVPGNVAVSAAAPDRGIQFNSGGEFGADANFVFSSVGNVGIGTATPQVTLDVNGETRIGSTNVGCDMNIRGSLRFDSGNSRLEICDGAAWVGVVQNQPSAVLTISPSANNSMNVAYDGVNSPTLGSTYDFTVRNIGNINTDSLTMSLTGDTGNFDVTADTCTGNVLTPSATCTITVQPKASGNVIYRGVLMVPHHNAPTAALEGEGTGFGCAAGVQGGGGVYVTCGAYNLVAVEAGCADDVSEPACSGGADPVIRQSGSFGISRSNTSSTVNGPQNTVNLQMYADTDGAGSHPAAEYCMALEKNGFDDWYLPARDELISMCNVQGSIGGMTGGSSYWSSTQVSGNDANRVAVSGCGIGANYKSDNYRVRCVRRETQSLPSPQYDTVADRVFYAPVMTTTGNRVSSGAKAVSGITSAVTASLSGDTSGGATFRINGGAEVTSGNVVNGDTIELVMTAPGSAGNHNTVDLTVGTGSPIRWKVAVPNETGTRRAFIAPIGSNGGFGGVTTADNTCQSTASGAGLGGTWKAIISDQASGSEYAANRIDYNWDTITNMNGDVVATGWADLWDGTLNNPINRTVNNTVVTSNYVWTGTASSGIPYQSGSQNDCNSWTDIYSYSRAGTTSTGGWTANASQYCNNSGYVYCFEETPSGTGDTTPVAFNIDPMTYQTTAGNRLNSPVITISGIDTSITVGVTAPSGNPKVKINGGAEVDNGSVSNGDTVQFVMTAPTIDGQRNKMTITAGTYTTYWYVAAADTAATKRVFVTSTTYNAGLGGVAGADAKCQARADAAALGGTWTALITDQGSPDNYAINRTSVNWGTLVNMNNQTVATGWTDLWDGSITNPINRDEFNAISSNTVWTGTASNGRYVVATTGNDSNGWTSGSYVYYAYRGNSGSVSGTFLNAGNAQASDLYSLYCVETTNYTPGSPSVGLDKQILFNNAGTMSGDNDLTWDNFNKELMLGGSLIFTSSTTYLSLPSGATADRPSSPVDGMIRYNSENGKFEGYQSGSWQDIVTGAATGTFAGLTDTPASYAAEAGKFVRVNSTEDGVEFTDQVIESVSGQPLPTAMILDDLGDVTIAGPTTGQTLSFNGTAWVNSSSGLASAGGSNTQVQFNSGGALAGSAGFAWDNTLGRLTISTTDSVVLPAGSTAQRPSSPTNGMIRYNSENGKFEGYQAGSWQDIVTGAATGTFAGLTDTPASYAGSANMYVRVNTAEDGLEFTDSLVPTVTGEPAPVAFDLAELGDVSVASPSNGQALVWNGSVWEAQALGAGNISASGTNRTIQFNSGGSFGYDDNFVFTSSGQIGLGTNSPVRKFDIVVDDAYDPVIRFYNQNANGVSGFEVLDNAGDFKGNIGQFNFTYDGLDAPFAIATNDNDIAFITGDTGSVAGTVKMMIDATTGYVGIGNITPSVALDVTGDVEYTGVLTDVSDRRLKNNIVPLNDRGSMLEKLGMVDTYSFTMKNDDSQQVEFGVMAQDLQTIFPELVRVDETSPEHYLSVNYIGMIAPMIEATKELKAENEALKAELASLRTDREDMMAALDTLTQDVQGLKAHTGYGINKASVGLGMLIGLLVAAAGSGLIIFTTGFVRRRRPKTEV